MLKVFQDEAATTLRGQVIHIHGEMGLDKSFVSLGLQVTHLEKNLQEAGKIREDKWVNVHGAAELEVPAAILSAASPTTSTHFKYLSPNRQRIYFRG